MKAIKFLVFIILFIMFLMLLTSCKNKAESTHKAGDFEIEFLFEYDGCKVYRFYDNRTVYFSDCRGKIESTTTTGHVGKTTTTHYHETLNN